VVEDGSNKKTFRAPIVEEFMKQLEKLNAEVKRLKEKDKKGKKHSSSSEDDDSSFEEEISSKGKKEKKNHDKSSYNAMSFNYDNMPSSTTYTFIPIGEASYFDGSNYNQWKHCMKIYLYSISPEVWQVVYDGVDFPEEDEQPTPDQLQKIHCNAQAITILTSSVDKEEFNRVDGLDEAKEVSTTIRMAHEGSKLMRKAKIDMLEGQLNRFVMFDDDKKKSKLYKKDKGYKRSDKPYKKKSYGEAHIGQEWESNNESSNPDSDGVATVAVKGTSSSSKSLFPKLNKVKNTCLMVKESKHKVKTKVLSSNKYVSSDDDTSFPNCINEKGFIRRLGKELVAQDQLLEDQEDFLEQERKRTCELKKHLNLEKEKNEELVQGKETISSLEGSIGALQDSYDVLKKTHKDLEVQFDAL
jgi:hypothetical protein